MDDGSWAHMVHAYVHLQEGNIVEGEQNITNAMKAALIRCTHEYIQSETVSAWLLFSHKCAA